MELRDPQHRVSPRARWLWVAEAALQSVGVIVVLVVVTGPWDWFSLPGWGWFALVVVGIVYVVVMPTIRYAVHRWETTPNAVYTQSGWIRRERRIAPLSRVQTIDFEQGALSRALRLAEARVTTASAAGPVKIKGVEKYVAEDIVADLTERTATTTGDAT